MGADGRAHGRMVHCADAMIHAHVLHAQDRPLAERWNCGAHPFARSEVATPMPERSIVSATKV